MKVTRSGEDPFQHGSVAPRCCRSAFRVRILHDRMSGAGNPFLESCPPCFTKYTGEDARLPPRRHGFPDRGQFRTGFTNPAPIDRELCASRAIPRPTVHLSRPCQDHATAHKQERGRHLLSREPPQILLARAAPQGPSAHPPPLSKKKADVSERQKHSNTSAYSLMSLPENPGCPLSSHPTTVSQSALRATSKPSAVPQLPTL